MRTVVGASILAVSILLVVLLRPHKGKEKPIVRLPGMWIGLGLLLTTSIGTGVALIVTSAAGW